jgi:hypothetical protein
MSPRARALWALAATATVGFAAGVAIDRAWLAPRGRASLSEPALLSAMRREVGLDDSQVVAVRAILERHQTAVDSAWQAIRPNVHAAIAAAQLEIAQVLRPEQRERYLRWIKGAHPNLPVPALDSGRH